MRSVIYQLEKLKRLTGFEYTLDEVGVMINHCAMHKNNKLKRFFFCFGFNRDKYSLANGSTSDDTVTFGLLPPGEVLNSTKRVVHDELFFSYPESLNSKIQMCFHSFLQEGKIHCVISDKEEFMQNLAKIRRLLQSRMTLGNADKLDALAMQMILSAIGEFDRTAPVPAAKKLELEDHRILQIAERLKNGENLQTLIRKYGYSRRAFYYEWKKYYSVSPKEMLLDIRLEKAQHLLLHSTLQISQIAEQCQFSSHRYFHECFVKHFSCTPGEYRKHYT